MFINDPLPQPRRAGEAGGPVTRGVRSRPLKEPEPDPIYTWPEDDGSVYFSTAAQPGASELRAPEMQDPFKAAQWRPGQSGNPAGRPPVSLKASLRKYIDFDEFAQAIAADCRMPGTAGADNRWRVFEHFEGKAKQALELAPDDDSLSLLARLTFAIEAASRGEPVPPQLLPPATEPNA